MTESTQQPGETDPGTDFRAKVSSTWNSIDKDKLTDMVHKVASETESIIKKYPVASVFAALTVGFALGSLVRRSRD